MRQRGVFEVSVNLFDDRVTAMRFIPRPRCEGTLVMRNAWTRQPANIAARSFLAVGLIRLTTSVASDKVYETQPADHRASGSGTVNASPGVVTWKMISSDTSARGRPTQPVPVKGASRIEVTRGEGDEVQELFHPLIMPSGRRAPG